MEPKMDTETKAIRDKLDAYQEKTETSLKPRETENKIYLEETEANPEKMQSEVEHGEAPTEDSAVKSLGTMRKGHGGQHRAAGQWREPKELTEEIVDPEGSWLPPARRCPVVQEKHRQVNVNCRRNWLQLAGG
jgi:hypothetical protein